MTLDERLAESLKLCEKAFREPRIVAAGELLNRGNSTASGLLDEMIALRKPSGTLLELARQMDSSGADPARPFERALLLRAAKELLGRIHELPVEESVRCLICKSISFIAAPPERYLPYFELSSNWFLAQCKIVRGVRYPAGQHQWEISGFPRSWLARVALRSLPGTVDFLIREARGFRPYFETHLAPPTHGVAVFLEREFSLAFHRMARSLEKQPRIRALMAVSWMHSPETHRVSPHLAFMNRPFVEAGGFITDIGPAHTEDGFLEGSPARAESWRAGLYKPTRAVALCSRRQALAWATAHSGLDELAMRTA